MILALCKVSMVMTFAMWRDIYYKFTTEFISESILQISLYLVELCIRIQYSPFLTFCLICADVQLSNYSLLTHLVVFQMQN